MPEDFASVGKWAIETFGPGTVQRRLERAGEELQEAIAEAEGAASTDKVMAEIADVLICLCGAARIAGGDLQKALDAKMAINRNRQWSLRGDGTGYHIPTT
jgi:NTP pyrophosphatase (non-canonical NTP hydrolase)